MSGCEARRLRLFENGNPDWCVAYDEADALAVWAAATGENPADYYADDWAPVDDDKARLYWLTPDGDLTSHDNEDGGALVPMTAAQVCAKFGHGFYASSDH